MENIHIHVGKPVSNVISQENVELVTIPESDDVVRERQIERRIRMEVQERIDAEIQKQLDKLEPAVKSEKEAEYKRGYGEGKEAGIQEERANFDPRKKSWSATIQEIIGFKNSLIKESEKTIVEMALSFARIVIGREIRTETDVIREQVKKAIEYNISEGKLVFHVNPEDIGQFEQKEEFIPEEYLQNIVVIPDETVGKGGCVLMTNSGMIDATIKEQFAELEANVLKGLESNSESDAG